VKRNLISFGFGVLGFVLSAVALVLWNPPSKPSVKLEPVQAKAPTPIAEVKPLPVSAPAEAPSQVKTEPVVPTKSAPKPTLDNIYQILSENYVDQDLLKAKDIHQAAVKGILNSLDGSVALLNADHDSKENPAETLTNITVLDPAIGYIRVNRLENDTPVQLTSEVQKLVHEKNITDLILDLRFASSTNFTAAADVASLFLTKQETLFSVRKNGKSEDLSAKPPQETVTVPLVLLVNHETRGAFEVVAAVLQAKGRALVVGNSSTANQIYKK
jgi:C-terminal processing protease CtpA/Prc